MAGAAWALSGERMRGMDGGPGTDLGAFGWFAVSWLVMMLPVVAPMVAAYRRITASAAGCALFAAGYLGVWVVTGLAGYAAIEGVRSLDLEFLGWEDAGGYLAAAAIAAAGL